MRSDGRRQKGVHYQTGSSGGSIQLLLVLQVAVHAELAARLLVVVVVMMMMVMLGMASPAIAG